MLWFESILVRQIERARDSMWHKHAPLINTCACSLCVERERERASSTQWLSAQQLPLAGYRERTTGGNLEVKLKTTTREEQGGCAARSRRASILPSILPSFQHPSLQQVEEEGEGEEAGADSRICAPHTLSLWASSREEERRTREEDQRGGCADRRSTMEGMQAYGAGKAGGAFDPITFFQQPQTILRIVSWVSEKNKFFILSNTEWTIQINKLIMHRLHVHMSNMGENYFYLFMQIIYQW